MNKLIFALAGATLALAACSGGGDADNAATNEPTADELNQMASDAANDAANAEAAALGDQLNQLENAPAADTSVSASDDQEQNVAGM